MQSMRTTWYVQVNGQAYGPYDTAQMQDFVAEGRVNAQSIISQSAQQGYAPAAQFPVFAQWSDQQVQIQPTEQQAQVLRPMSNVGGGVLARQMQPVGQAPLAVAPNPTPVQRAQITPQAVHQTAANTVILVMAEIRSGNGMQFLQACLLYTSPSPRDS